MLWLPNGGGHDRHYNVGNCLFCLSRPNLTPGRAVPGGNGTQDCLLYVLVAVAASTRRWRLAWTDYVLRKRMHPTIRVMYVCRVRGVGNACACARCIPCNQCHVCMHAMYALCAVRVSVVYFVCSVCVGRTYARCISFNSRNVCNVFNACM